MKVLLQRLIEGGNLAQSESAELFDAIMGGTVPPAQVAGLLVALRAKGETVEEIAGAASSMRRHAVFIDAGGLRVVDTCGTGGDGSGTFNISTTAAFVVAGSGVPVAKHGNRAISSQCGSADVLTALGVNIEVTPDVMESCIREAGIGFLYAPKLHPAMKHAMGVRRELGVRTIFNLLGPLTNPAGARGQVLGVFAPELTECLAEVLRLLGSQRAFVVHGSDGLDEITVTGPSRICELREGRVSTYNLDPLRYFGQYAEAAELRGGTPDVNAGITRRVLAGEKGACRDIVCINAAAAIAAGGRAPDIEGGLELARQSIDSGYAQKALDRLVALSKAG